MAIRGKLHIMVALLLLFLLCTHPCEARLLKEAKDQDVVPPSEKIKIATNTMEMPVQKGKLPDRYRPLVLNMLPRGNRVPPSGPSHGTNELNG